MNINTWINGSFPPETWNMFQHEGQTTNNHAEGYNFKLGNIRRIAKHPNIFQFVETINQELRSSHDEAVMEQAVWGMVREVDEDDLDTEVEIQSTNTEDTEKRS